MCLREFPVSSIILIRELRYSSDMSAWRAPYGYSEVCGNFGTKFLASKEKTNNFYPLIVFWSARFYHVFGMLQQATEKKENNSATIKKKNVKTAIYRSDTQIKPTGLIYEPSSTGNFT